MKKHVSADEMTAFCEKFLKALAETSLPHKVVLSEQQQHFLRKNSLFLMESVIPMFPLLTEGVGDRIVLGSFGNEGCFGIACGLVENVAAEMDLMQCVDVIRFDEAEEEAFCTMIGSEEWWRYFGNRDMLKDFFLAPKIMLVRKDNADFPFGLCLLFVKWNLLRILLIVVGRNLVPILYRAMTKDMKENLAEDLANVFPFLSTGNGGIPKSEIVEYFMESILFSSARNAHWEFITSEDTEYPLSQSFRSDPRTHVGEGTMTSSILSWKHINKCM